MEEKCIQEETEETLERQSEFEGGGDSEFGENLVRKVSGGSRGSGGTQAGEMGELELGEMGKLKLGNWGK